MNTNTEESYERDHSHYHCWQSSTPPCGQKIEHLKCCLCQKPHPDVTAAHEKGREDEKEGVTDRIKRHYNGFGGTLGFTESELRSLVSPDIPKDVVE